MDKNILDLLTKERVCSLTILVDSNPHASAMHFSHKDDPLILYFSTESTSRKCKSVLEEGNAKASVVVGFSEEDWLTMQMNGEVSLVDNETLKEVKKIHYLKHPKSQKYENDPETIFLQFKPSWWRYSDLKTDPPLYISSN